MIDTVNTISMLVKVLLAFFVICAFIPSKIIKFDEYADKPLDKLFIGMVHANLVLILIAHFLSFIKVYETFSILLSLIAIYILLTRIKGKELVNRFDEFVKNKVVAIVDTSERRLGLLGALKKKIRDFFKRGSVLVKNGIIDLIRKPFKGILIAAVLALAAYIRFHHSLTRLYLGASDCYVHLAWAKYMGNNNIYLDGIYPSGYHAVITSLNKIFLLDPYYIERFIGPLAGFLIVLSLFYVLKRNLKEPIVVWLGLFLYVANLSLPSDVWRQISALSQEYAAIFFLPGMYFFSIYFKSMKNKYLLLAAECAALTLLIHPYVTVFTLIGYFCVVLTNIKTVFKFPILKKLILYMGSAGLLGVSPLLIGRLMGHEWEGTFRYVQRMIKTGDSEEMINIFSFSEPNKSLILFLICAAFIIPILYFLKNNKKLLKEEVSFKGIGAFLLMSLLLYVMYRAGNYGLPEIMDPNRVGIFLSITVVVVFASILYIYDLIPFGPILTKGLKCVTAIVIALFVLFNVNIKIPKGFQMEYDGAVLCYLNIKNGNYGFQNWTIVSPTEQYQQAMNYGKHYQLWQFLYAVENTFDEETENNLEIPTDYIFIYVEKIPLYFDPPISYPKEPVSLEYSQKPLPPIMDEMVEFYTKYENRMILESKAYFWAEEYMKTHDDMEVFYEDDEMKVYMITQDADNPITF